MLTLVSVSAKRKQRAGETLRFWLAFSHSIDPLDTKKSPHWN